MKGAAVLVPAAIMATAMMGFPATAEEVTLTASVMDASPASALTGLARCTGCSARRPCRRSGERGLSQSRRKARRTRRVFL